MLNHRQDQYTFKCLTIAVATNDLATAKKCLAAGVNPNGLLDADQPSLLFMAVELGNYRMVKLLLNYNADPLRCSDKFSPYAKAIALQYFRIAKLLPEAYPQDWFITRMELVAGNLGERNNGICFAIANLSLIIEPTFFAAIFNEMAKIAIENFQDAYKHGENISKKLYEETAREIELLSIQQIEVEFDSIHFSKEVRTNSPEAKRQILRMISLEQKTRDLPVRDRVLIFLPSFFAAIKLLTTPQNYESTIFGVNSINQVLNFFSFKQEKYVHDTLKLIMPISLEHEGGLKCIDNFSGTFTKDELQEQLDHLASIISQSNLQERLLCILKANEHTIRLGIQKAKPIELININFFPVNQVITDHVELMQKLLRSLYTNNDITSFSALIYAKAFEAIEAQKIVHQWRQTNSFQLIQQATTERLALQDTFHSSWFDTVEHGADAMTTAKVLGKKKELQLIMGTLCLGLSLLITAAIANFRDDNDHISNLLTFALAFVVMRYLSQQQLLSKTKAIHAEIKKFNTEKEPKQIIKIVKDKQFYFFNAKQLEYVPNQKSGAPTRSLRGTKPVI